MCVQIEGRLAVGLLTYAHQALSNLVGHHMSRDAFASSDMNVEARRNAYGICRRPCLSRTGKAQQCVFCGRTGHPSPPPPSKCWKKVLGPQFTPSDSNREASMKHSRREGCCNTMARRRGPQ